MTVAWLMSARRLEIIEIDQLDHLVLTVTDIEASCRFYSTVLGMQVITFAGGRKALRFGEQKINLHAQGREYDPRARHACPGSADICLISRTPMTDVIAHLESCAVPIVDGPVRRSGARSPLLSVYLRDPDGNLVEIANRIDDGDA